MLHTKADVFAWKEGAEEGAEGESFLLARLVENYALRAIWAFPLTILTALSNNANLLDECKYSSIKMYNRFYYNNNKKINM